MSDQPTYSQLDEAAQPESTSPLVRAANTPITRRDLFSSLPGAAAGAAALAAVSVAVVASGCSDKESGDSSTPDVLEVGANAIVTLESYKEVEEPESLYKMETILELSAGAQLFASGSDVAAVLMPGETAKPLSTVYLMGLKTERLEPALDQAVGQDEGFNIHEVRCSDSLLVWVESNFLTDEWRVYSASVDANDLKVGEPTLLDEGGKDYDAPEIAAVDSQAYWIVQPAEGGSKTTEDSLLKTNGGTAYTSHGRFNGGLYTSGKSVVCMPRAEAKSSVYYQLTAIQNGSVVATQVLPHGFRPNTFTYVNGAFSFGISAGYDYGDGIANVGTYIAVGDGTWLRLTRTPVTPAGTSDGWLFCKSSSRTVFIDTKKQRYFTINAPSGTESYGDYSVRTGDVGGQIYNYATVSATVDGENVRKVVVRSINLKNIG